MTRTVSASDAQKQFGRWADKALQEPVSVLRRGRESIYMISAEEYHRLRRLEREAFRAEDLDDATADLIARADYGT